MINSIKKLTFFNMTIYKSKMDWNEQAVKQAGALILSMRTAAGLTQAELSRKTGIDQSAISKLEIGRSKKGPTLSTLFKIADACGTSIELGYSPSKSDIICMTDPSTGPA